MSVMNVMIVNGRDSIFEYNIGYNYDIEYDSNSESFDFRPIILQALDDYISNTLAFEVNFLLSEDEWGELYNTLETDTNTYKTDDSVILKINSYINGSTRKVKKIFIEYSAYDATSPESSEPPATTPSAEVQYALSKEGNYAIVTGYLGNATEVSIESTYDGKNVTHIGAEAFANTSPRNITIPESITHIGDDAFYGCGNLESIKILGSVTEIGERAFRGCVSLRTVYIKDASAWCNIDFKDYYYSNPAKYAECLHILDEKGQEVTDVVLNDTVTEIPDYAFYNCKNLQTIIIPDGVTSIGSCAFLDCDALDSITIGKDVTRIGDGAFGGCDSLTSIKIPYGVTYIGNETFVNCRSLESVTIPNTVIGIGKDAFNGCASLEKVNITDVVAWCNIAFINAKANPLYYGKNLYLNDDEEPIANLTIPNTVTSIRNYTFYNCESIKSVTIPYSTVSIGDAAFSGCGSLTTVDYTGTEDLWNQISIGIANTKLSGANISYFTPQLESISIKTDPTNKEYWVGEELDITGLTLDATYSAYDGSTYTETVYSGFDVSGFDSSVAIEEQTITVKYNGKEATFNVKIKALVIESIELNTEPDKKQYWIGDTLDYSGLTLTVKYTNGSAKEISEGFTVTGFDGAVPGDKTVTVMYGGKTTTFMVIVKAAEITEIAISGMPQKTQYWVGETFDPNGLTLELTYSNGTTENVADGFILSDFDSSVAGEKTITVFYNDLTATFTVQVMVPGVASLEVLNQPMQTEYWIGEALNLSGLVLRVIYQDGQDEMITEGFTVSGFDSETEGEKTVILSYEDQVATLILLVKTPVLEAITVESYPIKTEYLLGEALDITGLRLAAHYSDGFIELLTEGFTVDGFDSETEGDKIVTVTYEGQYATFTVNVETSGLTDIKINTLPTDTEYWVGEALDTTGLTLTAIYSNGSSQVITEGYTISGFDSTTVGTKTITVTYEDFITAFDVTVTIGGTEGENLTWSMDDAGVLTISGTGNMTDYDSYSSVPWYSNRSNIKAVVIENSVTSVGDYAFYNCKNLTDVTIPSSVTSIGSSAFRNCSSLTSITIGDSVTSIGDDAFYNCSSLTSITIPDSVTSIEDFAFYGCSSLTSVMIPEGVTSIGGSAFKGCNSLAGITIPNGVISIEHYAFYDCASLTTVTIPNSVKILGDSAFGRCTGLVSVTIYSGNIGKSAFNGCQNLESLELGENVTYINSNAFAECSSLKEVHYTGLQEQWDRLTIGSNNEYLTNATLYIKQIESIEITTLPEKNEYWRFEALDTAGLELTVTYSDDSTSVITKGFTTSGFNSTDAGTKIITVIYKGKEATFNVTIKEAELSSITANTTSMRTEYYEGESLDTTGLTLLAKYTNGAQKTITAGFTCSEIDSTKLGTQTITVELGGKTATFDVTVNNVVITGIEATGEIKTVYYVDEVFDPSGLVLIANLNNKKIEYIKEGFTIVSAWAKPGNYKVTITYDSHETTIDVTVREPEYWSLTENTLNIKEDDYLTEYYNGTAPWAYKKESIKHVIIENGVTTIGDSAFKNCENLTSIEIPNSVTCISWGAFEGCSSLTSITIPDSVTRIELGAFYNCSSLESINIPEGIEHIYSYTFLNCSSLESISIPNSLKTVDSDAFYGCDSLIYYTDDVGNKYLGNSTNNFVVLMGAASTDIESCQINASTKAIYDKAFSGCGNLTSITIPDSVTSIGEYAFKDCSGLKEIHFINGARTILEMAFAGVEAVVYYTPGATWSLDIMKQYGGNLKWRSNLGGSHDLSYTLCADESESYYSVSGIGECTDTELDIPTMYVDLPVKAIADVAFKDCTKITKVTIPNSITSIGSAAFAGCTKLESITLPFVGHTTGDSLTTSKYPFGYIFGTDSYQGSIETEMSYYESTTGKTKPATYYIPESLNSVTVLGGQIEYGAFENCCGLTSVTLCDGISYISPYAFYNCSALAEITLPESLKEVNWNAFENCTGLEDVYYNSNADQWEQIEINESNTALTAATIHTNGPAATCVAIYSLPDKADEYSIGESLDTTGLKLIVDYDDGSQKIKDKFFKVYGFDSTTAGVKTVTVEYRNHKTTFTVTVNAIRRCGQNLTWELTNEGILNISGTGSMHFWSYSGGLSPWYFCREDIKAVSLENGITYIGAYAFKDCSNLESINIPDSIKGIGQGAFDQCSSLNAVYITDIAAWCNIYYYGTGDSNPLYHGANLYLNNELVTNLVIPDSVTSIGEYAFCGCSSVTNIVIPDSVTSIGEDAFEGCTNLAEILVNTDNTMYSSDDVGVLFNKEQTKIIHVPAGISGSYIIPSTVTEIGKVFSKRSSLTSVTIPKGVTSIERTAFFNCSSLSNISMSNSIVSIGDTAFYGCSSLVDFEIPDSVASIDYATFYGCYKLTSITIPNSVTSIGESAFRNCSRLRTINYTGTQEQWDSISIASGNDVLSEAALNLNYQS